MEFEIGRIFVRGNFIEGVDVEKFVRQFPMYEHYPVNEYCRVNRERIAREYAIRNDNMFVIYRFGAIEFGKLGDEEKMKYCLPRRILRRDLRPLLWRIYNFTGDEKVRSVIRREC